MTLHRRTYRCWRLGSGFRSRVWGECRVPRADAETAIWAAYLKKHHYPPFELTAPRQRGRAIRLGTSVVEIQPEAPIVARMEITHRVPQNVRDDWDAHLSLTNENLTQLRRRR